MKNILITSIAILLTANLLAQKSIEFTLAYGITAVDLEALVEEDEVEGTTVEEWDVGNIGFSGQFVFAYSEKVGFGAELMYQHLYWYSVRVPYGSTAIYREYSVSTLRFTPMVRFGVDQPMCLDAGLSFNFMDPLRIGLMLSGNYYIPLNDDIDLPLKFRIDIINNIVLTMPISLNAGIRIKM